jgi:hypothetical protein
MVFDHSLSSIGRVAPAASFALFSVPSVSTMTQQAPSPHELPPGTLPKLQPEKLLAVANWLVVSPWALKLPLFVP